MPNVAVTHHTQDAGNTESPLSGFGHAACETKCCSANGGRRSVRSIETSAALIDHDFMTMLMAPAGLVVVPAVDVVDNHRSISMTFPVLPVALAEPLDSHQPGCMSLHNDLANRAAVAGVPIIHPDASGNGAAANHDVC